MYAFFSCKIDLMERLPSLKAVHYFDAAVRYKSLTAAAEALHVTQSAVSRMVQTLEDDLQLLLFHRQGRVITLTPEGQAYHREISPALERIARAGQKIRGKAEEQGLNVGMNPAFAARWLVPRLPDFQKQHPNIRLNFISNHLDGGERADPATVWVRYGTGPWPGLVATPLPLQASLAVVCAPSLLKQHGPLEKLEDLLDKPLLAYTGGAHDLWQDFFEHFQLPTEPLDRSRRFQQLLTLAEAAVSGLGYALVPEFLVAPELESCRLIKALPQSYEFDRRHYMLHPQGAERDKKVMLFKRWLLAQARKARAPVSD
ncbi:hypothetical protein B9Z47_02050 [Limnohabitans sp. 2KL-1]|nr:hypothetical protein B9Z47_02050 [Limnohabitans sp. 2KL-1]